MSEEAIYRPFIDGQLLSLRDFRASDLSDEYQRWLSDGEVIRYIDSRFTPPSREALEGYVRKVQADGRTLFFAMDAKDTGRLIGTVKLGPIHLVHRYADLGILIGNKSYWGRGFGTEAIALVTRFAFDRLNLHKVTANCYAPNAGSLAAFKKAGYVVEGHRLSHCFLDGEYVDFLHLGIVNPRH